MEKTTRRGLLKVAAGSGVSAIWGAATRTEARAQQSSAGNEAETHAHAGISVGMMGPISEATVSFGYYPADATVDRMQVAVPGNRNGHVMIPNQITIRAGGMVNFIVGGNHQIVVYDDGILPGDINTNLVLPPPLNTLLNDPRGRVYRGTSPVAVPANFFGPNLPAADIPAGAPDRCEAVSFPKPGAYLVICGVRTHFIGGMYGFVVVTP
jgi:plastocyanin